MLRRSLRLARALTPFAAAVALAPAACTAPLADGAPLTEERTSASSDELVVLSPNVWRTLDIPVCWENPAAAKPEERDLVKSAIDQSWAAVTLLRFTGWGQCQPADRGVRITVVAPGAQVATLRQADALGLATTMTLDMTYFRPECGTVSRCVQVVAVHEFGHALGFPHEMDRPDAVPCAIGGGTPNPAFTLVGEKDPASQMNYCNTLLGPGPFLSAGDIKGAKQYYGSHEFTYTKKDAFEWGRYIYLFNGTEYTRWDKTLQPAPDGRIGDKYPRAIQGNWPGLPAAFTTELDATVAWGTGFAFFFKGNQHVLYNLVSDQAASGPTSTAGYFRNWPASWDRVDAGFRGPANLVYLFRGGEVLGVDINSLTVTLPPSPITSKFPGVFSRGIDSVFKWDADTAVFFRNRDYVKYSLSSGRVVDGPKPIVGNWAGVPFGGGGLSATKFDTCSGARVMCSVFRRAEYTALSGQCEQLGGVAPDCVFPDPTPFCQEAAAACAARDVARWTDARAKCSNLGGAIPACDLPRIIRIPRLPR